MSTEKSKPLSPIKWLLGVVVFLTVIAGSIAFGTWLAPRPAVAAPAPTGGILAVIFLILGGLLAAIGVGIYFIVMATNLFTFNFNQPYMPAYGRKLWAANLITGLFLQIGFALAISPVIARFLAPIVPPNLLSPLSIFIPFLTAAVLMIWWSPWAPLELKMIRKRMTALGITPEQVATAIPIGISNPAQSSFKRALVEQDMGLLWIEPQRLTYFGDSQSFNLAREQVIAIERKADAGSTSSYFGAVQVVITYRDGQVGEQRVRLHSEGDWTMTAKAGSMRDVAERLESWQASPHALAVPPTTGFEVQRQNDALR